MKISEMKNLTIKELQNLLGEKRTELSKLRIDINLGKLTTSHVLRNIKKEIARILTELNLRRLNNK
jgi:large subunit ribosomal protein L29